MFASFSPMMQKKSLNFSVKLGLRLTSWLVLLNDFLFGGIKKQVKFQTFLGSFLFLFCKKDF